MFGIFMLLFWLFSIFAVFWVWNDASGKRGKNRGCLWTLVVIALGPLGFIAYLIVRDAD